MRTGPYRHSVWFDVFGIVCLGAVLVGGTGYLLYQAGGGAGPGSTTVSQNAAPGPPAARPQPPAGVPETFSQRTPARSSPSSSSPLLGRRPGPAGPGGATVPFSASWRQQATPDLSNAAPSSPDAAEGPGAGAPSSGPSHGPGLNASRPGGALSSPPGASGRTPGRGAGQNGAGRPGWIAEAERLAGQARSLSRQFGQMTRDDGTPNTDDTEDPSSSRPSEDGSPSASARTNDRDVPTPPTVPIGGTGWLAAAGMAYALHRLRRTGAHGG